MRLDELDYDLPPDRIAQVPPAERTDARLLVLPREPGPIQHRRIGALLDLLRAGDLLVLNETRVLPARVFAIRATGGRVEVFFLDPVAPGSEVWRALLKAGGRPLPGERLAVAAGVWIRLVQREADGSFHVETEGGTAQEVMARHGCMPLPPYIRREPDDARAALDRERYQTVFARNEGAVAAPTAGLHLSRALIDALPARGIATAALTLHVGRGTFEPVRVEELDAHPMHVERYEIPPETAAAIRRTRAAGGRIVAVGTTSVRALEAAARASPDALPCAGAAETDLLIQPGYRFRVVDALLTNFHLPRSTLLALVYAFGGRDRVRAAYAEAIQAGYRFYSYGDAMFLA